MIFLDENKLKDKELMNIIIGQEVEQLKDLITSQNDIKQIFLHYMQTFVNSNEEIEQKYLKPVIEFLEKTKKYVDYCNENIAILTNYISNFEIMNKLILREENYIPTLDSNYRLSLLEINKLTAEMSSFLNSFISNAEFDFYQIILNKNDIKNDTPIQPPTVNSNQHNHPVSTQKDRLYNEVTTSGVQENTLIISEMSGKVILPFKISSLQKLVQEKPNKYKDIDEVIRKEYTIPLSYYKNTPIARFKQAYKLLRDKEKESITSAINLGLELIFTYNLHPAIITACKNLDELDIYLDCLDANEVEKFDCFNIHFEIAPTLVKKRKQY